MENIPYAHVTRSELGDNAQMNVSNSHTNSSHYSPMTFAQVGDVDVDVEVEPDTLLRTFAVV